MMNIKERLKTGSATKWFLPLCLFALLPLNTNAQKLIAEKTTVDIGRTGYQTPVTAVFDFKVKGSKKVRIESVQPDCNCTVVDFPRGDVGESFQIRMTYDARQLGHFDKQAAIVTSASKKPFYIRMSGVVLEDYVDLSGNFPVDMGDLRLDKNELEFDDVSRGDQLTQELYIYNNGTREYRPNLMHLPPYLKAQVSPERLASGQVGIITVTLNSSLLHDYGLTQTSVYLAGNPGDKVSPDHEIGVSAVLLPALQGLTEAQKQHAAKLQLSSEQVDILFEGKSKKTAYIELSNHGHAELVISSLQMFTAGLKISLPKSRLAPGESTRLKITALRDDLLKVRTRPRILMITNDPDKTKVTITINAK